MGSLFPRPLRQLAQALVANDSARQIAWGVVLGMMVGRMPSGNLIAAVLAMLLLSLRVNLAAGMMSVGFFSLVGPSLDAFAHRIGAVVLTWPPAQSAFAWLYEQPLGPWIGFNNTVVLGQLLIGIYLVYPVYWLSQTIASQLQLQLRKWSDRSHFLRVLRGAELGTG